jgi:hypothetical protein
MLFPAVLFHGEIGRVMALSTVESWDGRLFVWGSIITGVFGFLLCVAALISIKVTSPITHMFSSVSLFILASLHPSSCRPPARRIQLLKHPDRATTLICSTSRHSL